MMLTSTQAAEEFKDEIPMFREASRRAWGDILSKYNEPGWDNSCRSHVLQMQSVLHAKEIFHSNAGVKHFTIDNRHVFIVREKGLFHFKQFDENHCTSNARTPAAELFYSQSELPQLEGCQRFAVGLIAKADWTGYVGIYMTYPKAFRKKPNWVLNITGTPVDIEALQDEFDESVSQPERRIKPRARPGRRAGDSAV
jgi:hypothetical protein